MEDRQDKASCRKKGSGRIFVRGKVWYLRFRANGMETTKSTKIDVDESSQESFDRSRREALKVLDRETEILRLKDKESRLKIVKMMLEDTVEQIKDRVSGIQRNAPLSSLESIFRNSSRSAGCSDGQMAAYSRYICELIEKIGGTVRICDIDDGVADTFATWLSTRPLSPNTYNKRLNGYSLIWDSVMGRVGISRNPWTGIPRKRLDTSVRKALTEEESEAILAEAKEPLGFNDYFLTMLLAA